MPNESKIFKVGDTVWTHYIDQPEKCIIEEHHSPFYTLLTTGCLSYPKSRIWRTVENIFNSEEECKAAAIAETINGL